MAKNPLINPGGPKDPVTNPAHYTSTKISPIEVIVDWNLPFDIGNALKYIGRHRMKDGLKDLKKALWYLDHAIQRKIEEVHQQKINPYEVLKDWKMEHITVFADLVNNIFPVEANITIQRYQYARTVLAEYIGQLETQG